MAKVKPRLDVSQLPQAIYCGFSSHDCESVYRCPKCNATFGDWGLERTLTVTDHYAVVDCWKCKSKLIIRD